MSSYIKLSKPKKPKKLGALLLAHSSHPENSTVFSPRTVLHVEL